MKLTTTYNAETDVLTLEWDEFDPRAIALGINDWSDDQWLEALTKGLEAEQELFDSAHSASQ